MAISVSINQSVGTVEWTFSDGKVVLHVERLSPAVMAYAALHGLKQKAGDVMALKAEDFGGRVPEGAKKAELLAMVQWLESGTSEWNRKVARESTGGLLLQCLMEYLPNKSREQLQEYIKTLDAGARAKLLASDKIHPIAERIRAAAGKGIETDEMLGDLLADEIESEEDLDAAIAREMAGS
jgi:hypothetical protein